MAVTTTSFREMFPEFANVTTYPDPQVEMWVGVAASHVSTARWDSLADFGTMLFVAHNLVLGRMDQAAAAVNGTPGLASTGVVSSKSVGGVSVSYDTSSAMEPEAGHWGLTSYGVRFLRLLRLHGMGPVQVGAPTDQLSLAGAWPGPQYPFF